jgi:hypothetical protein
MSTECLKCGVGCLCNLTCSKTSTAKRAGQSRGKGGGEGGRRISSGTTPTAIYDLQHNLVHSPFASLIPKNDYIHFASPLSLGK